MNTMKLSDFFDDISISLAPVVYILQGDFSKSALFFKFVRRWIEKKHKKIIVIDLDQTNFSEIVRQLETSILGHTGLFWFLPRSEQKTKNSLESVHYFLSYKGPHTIVFCDAFSVKLSDCKMQESIVINQVDVSKTMDILLFQRCINEGIIGYSLQSGTVDIVAHKLKQISFDQATLLAEYLSICGKQKKHFIHDWLDRVIPSDHSLFLLSQYLLAKKSKDFFIHWSLIFNQYSVQFWVTFWAEQMWRSATYLQLMQQQNHAEAKKIVFRLPYSFVKRDWQNYSIKQLQDAHNRLYLIDCFTKRGGDGFGLLELFFTHFLMH